MGKTNKSSFLYTLAQLRQGYCLSKKKVCMAKQLNFTNNGKTGNEKYKKAILQSEDRKGKNGTNNKRVS